MPSDEDSDENVDDVEELENFETEAKILQKFKEMTQSSFRGKKTHTINESVNRYSRKDERLSATFLSRLNWNESNVGLSYIFSSVN